MALKFKIILKYSNESSACETMAAGLRELSRQNVDVFAEPIDDDDDIAFTIAVWDLGWSHEKWGLAGLGEQSGVSKTPAEQGVTGVQPADTPHFVIQSGTDGAVPSCVEIRRE